MNEAEYMKIHGIRFLVGFGLFLVYIFFIANFSVTTPSSQTWMATIVILLFAGIVTPWLISAVFFRRYSRLSPRNVINSFFVAPNVGLFSTLTIPPLYVIWMTAKLDDLWIGENWSIILITILYYGLNINVNLLQLWHAKKLKTGSEGVTQRRGQLHAGLLAN